MVDPIETTDTNNAVLSPSPAALQTKRTPDLTLKKTLHAAAETDADVVRLALRQTAWYKKRGLR
jgi:hypothetical protein